MVFMNIDSIVSFLSDVLPLSIIRGGKFCCVKHNRLQTITSPRTVTEQVLTYVILPRYNTQHNEDAHVLMFHLMQTSSGWCLHPALKTGVHRRSRERRAPWGSSVCVITDIEFVIVPPGGREDLFSDAPVGVLVWMFICLSWWHRLLSVTRFLRPGGIARGLPPVIVIQ